MVHFIYNVLTTSQKKKKWKRTSQNNSRENPNANAHQITYLSKITRSGLSHPKLFILNHREKQIDAQKMQGRSGGSRHFSSGPG